MRTSVVLSVLTLLMVLLSPALRAQGTLSPTVNFTLRDESPVDGTADLYDATPNGSGFDGFLTIHSFFQEDRHFVEFDMSLAPVGWTFTALTFTTAFSGASLPTTSLGVSWYRGNGLVDLSDWTVATVPVATIPGITRGGGQSFILDVTTLAASLGGSGYLGFRFELLDSGLNQKLLDAPSIKLTQVPEPSVAVLALVGAIAFLALRRRAPSRPDC